MSEVSAVAVVVGATEVIRPPAAPARVGARSAKARSCSHPSPSRTSRTTWRAPVTGPGSQGGGSVGAVPAPASAAEKSAGTTDDRHPPP
ncbi:MAG: hypothetical protein ABSG81_09055 [Acidimicrobiales bacterium]